LRSTVDAAFVSFGEIVVWHPLSTSCNYSNNTASMSRFFLPDISAQVYKRLSYYTLDKCSTPSAFQLFAVWTTLHTGHSPATEAGEVYFFRSEACLLFK